MFQQLLDNLRRYLNGQSTLQGLEAWLLSNLQRILDAGDKAAIHMANQIDADLVELGEGLIDELTLLERLESYLRLGETISFTLYETQPSAMTHATATAETFTRRSEIRGPVVDLRLVHSFA